MSPWRCFTATFCECCVNMACAPLFMAAIAIYAAYYCWPYMAQLPDHLHCAIVDADNSALSRRLIRDIQATPDFNVLQVTANRQEAILAMKSGEITTIVEIPANFARDIAGAIPTAITLTANGAYLVAAKMSTAGASGPLRATAQNAIADWLAKHGAKHSQLAIAAMEAPEVIVVPAYNTISGYLNFAVPIVFIAVFQTLMSAGTGMLFNAWFMRKPQPEILRAVLASPSLMLCAQLPILLICFFWCLFVEGPVFYLQGVNSFQNIPATFAICAAFSLAVSSFAVCLAIILGPTHFVMQAVVLSALPCVFISGNLWPLQNIPPFFQALGAIFPSTPGSQGIIRASQCGASLAETSSYIIHLILLAAIYFIFARLLAKRQLAGMVERQNALQRAVKDAWRNRRSA